jgi:hypothetical protein
MERPLFTLCATGILNASSLVEAGASLGASEFFAVLVHVLIAVVCGFVFFNLMFVTILVCLL